VAGVFGNTASDVCSKLEKGEDVLWVKKL